MCNPRERERERERVLFIASKTGIPIGNVTSQIFANIYLDQLDQFVKHTLKVKHYFRYADDFIFIHEDQCYLKLLLVEVEQFLAEKLLLQLHPHKISIRRFNQGIDFLGYIILPHYSVVRTKTRRRMFKKIKQNLKRLQTGLINQEAFNQSLQSYLGILKHCEGYKIKNKIEKFIFSRPIF